MAQGYRRVTFDVKQEIFDSVDKEAWKDRKDKKEVFNRLLENGKGYEEEMRVVIEEVLMSMEDLLRKCGKEIEDGTPELELA